jgi:hypothetical protein
MQGKLAKLVENRQVKWAPNPTMVVLISWDTIDHRCYIVTSKYIV